MDWINAAFEYCCPFHPSHPLSLSDEILHHHTHQCEHHDRHHTVTTVAQLSVAKVGLDPMLPIGPNVGGEHVVVVELHGGTPLVHFASLDIDRLEAGVGWYQGLPLALLECPLVLRPGALHGVAGRGCAGEAGDVLHLGLHHIQQYSPQ